jgi:formylglycine-generating enzyme required for sulfatase activity
LDLAGSVWEWTLDSYAPYPVAECADCANLSDPTKRVFRGGDYTFDDPLALRAASRYAFDPAFPDQTRGLRCATNASLAK